MGRGGDGEMGKDGEREMAGEGVHTKRVNSSLEPLIDLAFIRGQIPLNPPKARGTLIAFIRGQIPLNPPKARGTLIASGSPLLKGG